MYHQFAQIQYGVDHDPGEEYKLKESEKGREEWVCRIRIIFIRTSRTVIDGLEGEEGEERERG